MINTNHVLIGQDIANELNLNIGDQISIFYPSDINIATSFVINKSFDIYGIYDVDFLDFSMSQTVF